MRHVSIMTLSNVSVWSMDSARNAVGSRARSKYMKVIRPILLPTLPFFVCPVPKNAPANRPKPLVQDLQ